jgi:hypothetical protein
VLEALTAEIQKSLPNPFKPGELMDRAAKPAYNKVKVRALKLLKDMAKQPPALLDIGPDVVVRTSLSSGGLTYFPA